MDNSNYSYGTYSPRPDRSRFRTYLDNATDWQRLEFDGINDNPNLLWEKWLRMLMPELSNTQEKTLRSAYGSLYNDFMSRETDMRGTADNPQATPYRWVDYLANFDIEKEFARLDPSARYENQSRFTAPARWVAF